MQSVRKLVIISIRGQAWKTKFSTLISHQQNLNTAAYVWREKGDSIVKKKKKKENIECSFKRPRQISFQAAPPYVI